MSVGMFSGLQKCYALTCLVLSQIPQNLPNKLQLAIYLVLKCYGIYLIKLIFKNVPHRSHFCNHMIKRFPAELLTVITWSYITPYNEQKPFLGGAGNASYTNITTAATKRFSSLCKVLCANHRSEKQKELGHSKVSIQKAFYKTQVQIVVLFFQLV